MKERRHKVHYAQGRPDIGLCGLDGHLTYAPNDMTCRICMFRYLAMQAPWAPDFLDDLRGHARCRQSTTVAIPAAAAEPTDGKVEGTGHSQTGPFGKQCVTEEAIRESLAKYAALMRPIQPVMNDGGASAEPVWVQRGQIAEQAGDTSKVSYEPRRYNKAD